MILLEIILLFGSLVAAKQSNKNKGNLYKSGNIVNRTMKLTQNFGNSLSGNDLVLGTKRFYTDVKDSRWQENQHKDLIPPLLRFPPIVHQRYHQKQQVRSSIGQSAELIPLKTRKNQNEDTKKVRSNIVHVANPFKAKQTNFQRANIDHLPSFDSFFNHVNDKNTFDINPDSMAYKLYQNQVSRTTSEIAGYVKSLSTDLKNEAVKRTLAKKKKTNVKKSNIQRSHGTGGEVDPADVTKRTNIMSFGRYINVLDSTVQKLKQIHEKFLLNQRRSKIQQMAFKNFQFIHLWRRRR